MTDHDGQYVEIQAGLLESQFVTGWIEPQEVVRTGGSWFGTDGIGELTWANERVAAALVEDGNIGRIDMHSIDVLGPATMTMVTAAGTSEYAVHLRPGEASSIALPGLAPFRMALHSVDGRLLLSEEWIGGDDLRALDPDRPSDPLVQWAMQARAKPHLRKVEECLKSHAWEAARTALQEVGDGEIAPSRNLLLAELALKIGAFKEAHETAVEAALEDPGDAGVHALALASALRLLRVSGDPRWRYAVWDHAMVARRDGRFRYAALLGLAEAEILGGKLLSALVVLEELVDARPELSDPRLLLSGVRRRCGMPVVDAVSAEAEILPHAWCEKVLLETDPRVLPPLLAPCADTPEGVAHRDALVLEVILLYWRVGWHDDAARVLSLLQEREGVGVGQPVWGALQSDLLASAGDATGATDAAAAAAERAVDWVLPCRWEEAELLRRVESRLEGKGPANRGNVAYLMGVWHAEHGDVEGAVSNFKTCLESPLEDVRMLAGKALADWAESVAIDVSLAAGFLRALLVVRPMDRRTLVQLDDCLRAVHDVRERCALWESAPAELRERGDVTFRVARCALDDGRPDDAVQLLRGRRFSVYEGGTSVRRLYVDALLLAAMAYRRDADWAAADRRCRDVFDFPENLGAASYLGEHSRLARFLLGVFAEQEGRSDDARTWWEDVLKRSEREVTYVVGGEDSAASLRADERLAIMLSAKSLGRSLHSALMPPRSLDSESSSTDAVYHALVGGVADGLDVARNALTRYPCSSVLRILAGVGELVTS